MSIVVGVCLWMQVNSCGCVCFDVNVDVKLWMCARVVLDAVYMWI